MDRVVFHKETGGRLNRAGPSTPHHRIERIHFWELEHKSVANKDASKLCDRNTQRAVDQVEADQQQPNSGVDQRLIAIQSFDEVSEGSPCPRRDDEAAGAK